MSRPPAALMLQGTGSDVGKSLLVAGLARAYTRRGLTVRPFKPQNMSNNAAVAADGGEIGRAQALQARACGVAPSVDMNPVLLKPHGETGSQIVVQGQVYGTARAADYYRLKDKLLPYVLESFNRLSAEADLILIEGAGSVAEANLRASDIANMGFATAASVPVVLVADIDRGGALASLVGSWSLLDETDRRHLKGYIINKFRGDPQLFTSATEIIHRHTGLDCLGVVGFFNQAHLLPAEDAMALDYGRYEKSSLGKSGKINIAVPRLPRIANFDDLDPLAAEPDVAVTIVPAGVPLPQGADLILLPGSKATLSDLAYLRSQGWDIDILSHHRRGGRILGLCGGYQMLGRRIADPLGIEGPAGDAPGLGLLDVETVLAPQKTLRQTAALDVATGLSVRGYEIHMGVTQGADCARPMLHLQNSVEGRTRDGAISADGKVAGCYLHGLFAADPFRRRYLEMLTGKKSIATLAYEEQVDRTLDALADHIGGAVNLNRLLALASTPL